MICDWYCVHLLIRLWIFDFIHSEKLIENFCYVYPVSPIWYKALDIATLEALNEQPLFHINDAIFVAYQKVQWLSMRDKLICKFHFFFISQTMDVQSDINLWLATPSGNLAYIKTIRKLLPCFCKNFKIKNVFKFDANIHALNFQ